MGWFKNVKRIIISDEERDVFISLDSPSEDDVKEFCRKYDLNEDYVFDNLREHASSKPTYFFFEPRKLDEKWR